MKVFGEMAKTKFAAALALAETEVKSAKKGGSNDRARGEEKKYSHRQGL